MKTILDAQHLGGAILYSGLGVLFLAGGMYLFDKVTPYDLWNEILVKQNRALATVLAGVSIALGLIIAASMLG